ncbi:MAG: hypothetical protein Q9196_004580 [Gyalolechia fulgens]
MDDTRYTRPLSDFSTDPAANGPSHFLVSESTARNEQDDRIWTRIFSSNQQENESVAEYGNRIIALADRLTDIPWNFRGPLIFNRVKAGLLEPIKRGLRAQIVQPTSHAALNDMAMVIERTLGRQHSSAPQLLLENRAQRHAVADDRRYIDQDVAEQSEEIHYDDRLKEPLQVLGRYPVNRASEGLQGTKRRADSHQTRSRSPSNVDEYGQPIGRVSEQERKRRKEQNCCYGCGKPGHMRGECPEKRMGRGAQYGGGTCKKQKR